MHAACTKQKMCSVLTTKYMHFPIVWCAVYTACSLTIVTTNQQSVIAVTLQAE
jgi:hypothetical protein